MKLLYKGIFVAGILLVLVCIVLIIVCSNRDRIRKNQSVKEYLKQPGYIFTAPFNVLYEKYSHDQTSAILDISDRVDMMRDFSSNWQTIRDEGLAVVGDMKSVRGDLFFPEKITKDDLWKKMYIKWYGNIEDEMIARCPITTQILQKHPEIHLAMFSLLKKGGRIYPHCGPFRGCIRVHIGLQTPNDDRCFIKIGKEVYSWRDGEIVAFDDTYRHEVFNNSDQDRLILFLDIERKMKTPFAHSLNQLIIKHIAPLTTRSNSRLEKVIIQ